jgi:hypothetical protein
MVDRGDPNTRRKVAEIRACDDRPQCDDASQARCVVLSPRLVIPSSW